MNFEVSNGVLMLIALAPWLHRVYMADLDNLPGESAHLFFETSCFPFGLTASYVSP